MEYDEGGWITGNVTLMIGGEPLDLRMTVPKNKVKLSRMLPVFQQMTNSFIEMSERAANSLGREISCRKGCGACCRQMVPLAEVETYTIAELVESLPEPRRAEIKRKFAEAVERCSELGIFERLESAENHEERRRIVIEYFYENIACPFLEDESCSIHEERPIACREYLVTSPAENCKNPTAENIEMLEIPIKPSTTLVNVGYGGKNRRMKFVPLVQALEWAEKFPDQAQEKTGEDWMREFFTILTKSEIPH